MADWISQYSAALDIRDTREKAHKSYIDAYTKLADRTASLEQTSSPPEAANQVATANVPTKPGPDNFPRTRSPATPDITAAATSVVLARLRADLSSTQRSRAQLETQLTRLQSELETQTTRTTASTRRIEVLTKEKRELEHRVADRDAELRIKGRMVNEAQDQMVALTLQLNLNEERMEKITDENDMLVRRWMDKMAQEAERMNVESRWA